eukprot:gene6495-6723_t
MAFTPVNAGAKLQGEDSSQPAAAVEPQPAPVPRENAVLVFGATGKMGRRIVEKLVRSGRTVIAAARSAEKASEVFSTAGLKEGYQQEEQPSSGILFVNSNVDVTDPSTLTAELFKGVTQVVSALGPVAGRLPDGTFGYIDGMSPDRVEVQGMANILAALSQHVPQLSSGAAITSSSILPMRTAEDLEAWDRLDDVIMGGGFCGARTKPLNLDLSSYDGLQMHVKGDGQIFKFNIKTADQEDVPESTYQATFDTSPDGDWTTVRLPWHNFVPVKRAQSDPAGASLDPSQISKFGLVLSRFEFNKMPNPAYKPGAYTLEIDGGISAYKAPRPAVVAVSSAGVERNAVIGDDAEARKRDIPIVQLNPGGVLNYKYEAECVVRASGLPYTVIRCTGLDDRGNEGPALLEADQGDTISGKVSRDEAADTVLAVLASPEAAYKTFELRRSEAADAQGKPMNDNLFTRLLLKQALDRNRWRVGLRPFPKAVPPPPPPSEDRTKEILADPRVQAVRQRAQQTEQQEPAPQEGQQAEEKERELVSSKA